MRKQIALNQARSMTARERSHDLREWVPQELQSPAKPQTAIPAIAKDPRSLSAIWTALIHGERPGWWPVAGGAIILAATVWNATRPATETAPAALAAARR